MENYTLIICEKKDVATKLKDYFERNGNSYTPMKGYYMSDTKNKYEITCITWLAGHILTDYEPEEYDPSWKNWSTGPLPMIPEEFKKKPKKCCLVFTGILLYNISRQSVLVRGNI